MDIKNKFKKDIKYTSWDNFNAKSDWTKSQDFYGKAFIISRAKILSILIVTCIVTPFTNWLIPILPKVIKKDLIVRYE